MSWNYNYRIKVQKFPHCPYRFGLVRRHRLGREQRGEHQQQHQCRARGHRSFARQHAGSHEVTLRIPFWTLDFSAHQISLHQLSLNCLFWCFSRPSNLICWDVALHFSTELQGASIISYSTRKCCVKTANRGPRNGLYVVERNFFLLLLNCSAWPCLDPA